MRSSDPHSATTESPAASSVSVRVEDMTCGHCVGTIRDAIESAVPDARVQIDLAARIVSVDGGDFDRISAIIRDAGYTPGPVRA